MHSNTLFDSCLISESVSSWKRKNRITVQIRDYIAASLKEKQQRVKFRWCVIVVLSRMCFRCMSGSSDSENKLSIYDPYASDLFSVWFIWVFWNENREFKLEVEFILVGIINRVWLNIGLKCHIGRWESFRGTSSEFTSFIRSWSLF